MIAINLNKNLSCEHICESIQKLIDSYKKDRHDDLILVINIKKINYNDHTMIPKIEHKPSLA